MFYISKQISRVYVRLCALFLYFKARNVTCVKSKTPTNRQSNPKTVTRWRRWSKQLSIWNAQRRTMKELKILFMPLWGTANPVEQEDKGIALFSNTLYNIAKNNNYDICTHLNYYYISIIYHLFQINYIRFKLGNQFYSNRWIQFYWTRSRFVSI